MGSAGSAMQKQPGAPVKSLHCRDTGIVQDMISTETGCLTHGNQLCCQKPTGVHTMNR